MAIQTPSIELIKSRAKVIREILKAKYGVDVAHGHCLEIVSQLFGKSWNSASAAAKRAEGKPTKPVPIKTVGDMRHLLSQFEDNMKIVVHEDELIEAEIVCDSWPEKEGWRTNVNSLEMSPERVSNSELVFALKLEKREWMAGSDGDCGESFEGEPTKEELREAEEAGDRWAVLQADLARGK